MKAAYWLTPTRLERARIWLAMKLLAAAWRALPRKHPGYRGIFDAACAIRDPVLSENTSGVAVPATARPLAMEARAIAAALIVWKNATPEEWANERRQLEATLSNASRVLAELAAGVVVDRHQTFSPADADGGK